MEVFEETNEENLNVLMPFSVGTYSLKICSIRQHVGGFKYHLNGYFWGLVPWSDFPSVQCLLAQPTDARCRNQFGPIRTSLYVRHCVVIVSGEYQYYYKSLG